MFTTPIDIIFVHWHPAKGLINEKVFILKLYIAYFWGAD